MGTMITWYNFEYYKTHFEQLGFVKEKEYIESKFPFENVKLKYFDKAQETIKKRYQLKALSFTSTKEVMPYVDKMFDLFNASYANLSSFVAISDAQKEFFKKKYINFINPEYIKYVEDKNGDLVAFAIVMPSFSKALQRANGKLFPFGFLHLLNARKNSKEVLFYLIGVHPAYQNKGVHAIIFKEYHTTFTERGIKNCIRTPELADNLNVQLLWKNFDPVIVCRRKTFKIDL
jgi:GNAT superfamily N-acetyltransferase